MASWASNCAAIASGDSAAGAGFSVFTSGIDFLTWGFPVSVLIAIVFGGSFRLLEAAMITNGLFSSAVFFSCNPSTVLGVIISGIVLYSFVEIFRIIKRHLISFVNLIFQHIQLLGCLVIRLLILNFLLGVL